MTYYAYSHVEWDAKPYTLTHPTTLTFDLSTSTSNQFIFVPKCSKIVNVVKLP